MKETNPKRGPIASFHLYKIRDRLKQSMQLEDKTPGDLGRSVTGRFREFGSDLR